MLTIKETIFNQFFDTDDAKAKYVWAHEQITAWQALPIGAAGYYEKMETITELKRMITEIDEFLEFMADDPEFRNESAALTSAMVVEFINYINTLGWGQNEELENDPKNNIIFLTSGGTNIPENLETVNNYVASDVRGATPSEKTNMKIYLDWLLNGEGVFEVRPWHDYLAKNQGNIRGYYLKLNDNTLLLVGLFVYNDNDRDKKDDRPVAYHLFEDRINDPEVKAAIQSIQAIYLIENEQVRNQAIATLLIENDRVAPTVFAPLSKDKDMNKKKTNN